MNDTDVRIEQIQRERILRLTPTDRVRMGSSMFETTKELMENGFRARFPNLDSVAIRPLVFKALYGSDLDEVQRKKIEAHLFS